MNKQAISRSLGWFTLGALVALAPQLSGCTEEKSQRSAESVTVTPALGPKDAPAAPTISEIPEAPNTAGATKAEAPASEPETTVKPTGASASQLAPTISRLVVTRDVKDREPVDSGEMTATEPVVAFLEMKHLADTEVDVVVTFEHEAGKKVGFIELTVPGQSPRFRTWGRTRNIKEPGAWVAVVSTKEGVELARKEFTVAG